jgi:hypothetical protein
MKDLTFDERGRFVLPDYAAKRPFASFLPGIAGPLGIPMWVFYVNRGQAIASFGVENKDNPIMEFEPANKAYQVTPYTGFRTFLKLKRGGAAHLYEPFAPWSGEDELQMCIGMNELELQARNTVRGIQTNVLYFTLPGEPFAGLVREVTLTNLADEPLDLEMLDGMARVMPYGVDNRGLKEMGRTIEAWMAVYNLQEGLPFYRVQASFVDTDEVSEIQAGHFYLAFDASGRRLVPFVDPTVVFGQNTALSTPDAFLTRPLADLSQQRQITTGRTPCGMFGTSTVLAPGEAMTLYAIIGHTSDFERLNREQARLAQPAYLQQRRRETDRLAEELTEAVETRTSSPRFDAYIRQTFLDNVLRGGWPLLLGNEQKPAVFHIYSRKHGDLERDYNYFSIAAEPYSQGNGAYRDVNQNRRSDVLLQPEVGAFNVLSFLGLIQADGYNPLVVEGSRFTLSAGELAGVLALAEQPEKLEPVLAHPFTPGKLLQVISDQEIELKVSPEVLVAQALSHAEQHFHAAPGEGYWIDHWTYNLDLIETYLAVYPEEKDDLLFSAQAVPYFDSPAVVQPRTRKYVLAGEGKVRQYGAVLEDEEKAALIAGRTESPNLMRTAHGKGDIYRTTVFAKLVSLALLKFASLDAWGMGIEMEAGKPGWYDALNGLPGLLGSSLCETYELDRLLAFLLEAITEKGEGTLDLPIEQVALMETVVESLHHWHASADPERDFCYWDAVTSARETYRASVRLGLDGETKWLSFEELTPTLEAFQGKVRAGIQRAVKMNQGTSRGIPPTYFAYTVTDYDLMTDAGGEAQCDEQGRPYVRAKRFEPRILPLFLEGPVHALKVQSDVVSARDLYTQLKATDLYDRKLGMYKVNASLRDESHEIGRARAFTPGWLENESVFLHMAYKYLLEVLRAGLYKEFFDEFQRVPICFQDPDVYGRSPLENSSFLVSSAHPDASLHGAGFVARLTGATAEFLSIWTTMMAGRQPFFVQDGKLGLRFRPALPGWLFDKDGRLTFTFLGRVPVTYHNYDKRDLLPDNGMRAQSMTLQLSDQRQVECVGDVIDERYSRMVRAGEVRRIDVHFPHTGSTPQELA